MQEYKSNSHLSKQKAKEIENNKNIQKVVSGTAKRKKNEARRFADIFIREDISNVKSYVFMDVLVPAIKKAISDIVTDGVDMILFGTTGRNGKKGNTISGTYKNYASFSSNNSSRESDFFSPFLASSAFFLLIETLFASSIVSNAINLSPALGVSLSPVISTGVDGPASTIFSPLSFFIVLTLP